MPISCIYCFIIEDNEGQTAKSFWKLHKLHVIFIHVHWNMWDVLKAMPPSFSMETTTKYKNTVLEKILSYRTLFFNLVITISYVFLSVKNKSLHTTLVKTCTSGGDLLLPFPQLKHHPPHHCAHIHCLVSITIWQASTNITGLYWYPTNTCLWHLRPT